MQFLFKKKKSSRKLKNRKRHVTYPTEKEFIHKNTISSSQYKRKAQRLFISESPVLHLHLHFVSIFLGSRSFRAQKMNSDLDRAINRQRVLLDHLRPSSSSAESSDLSVTSLFSSQFFFF